jgi:bifunctional UDP-N-acetylglucosamine pyrophosphorylase/glucosamine-1-phosphate N-acetyltransferase
MQNKDQIKIIILAAGKSTRMKSDTPKALTPFKGKAFIKHILDTIQKVDTNLKPVIVIGHKKELIKEALGENHTYAVQTEQLGTGHAVLSAKDIINFPHGIMLVLSTDQPLVSKKTLESLIKKHEKEKPSITIGTVIIPDFKDWRVGLYHFGRIIRGTNGAVKQIVEFKNANDEEKEVKELNPALYVFDAEWLWNNIDKLKNTNAQGEYYLTDLIKMACDQNKKVETVQIENIHEALQPNSQEELRMLEKITS